MRLSLIAAMAENRVIGNRNALPWRLPADLKHFRGLTTGHHVIMGRKTYESLGKPLPERTNIVVTRKQGYAAPGCIIAPSMEAALAVAGGDSEVFVIGGANCYAQTLARADRLYLTLVHASFDGDVRFPAFDWNDWHECERKDHPADAANPYPFSFITLEKRRRDYRPS